MKRNEISDAVAALGDSYIEEAAHYEDGTKRSTFPGKWLRAGLAAALALCLLAGGLGVFSKGDGVTAYAYGVYGGSSCELTAKEVILSTGTISDSGEMTGHPLSFVLRGENIESVRFSCKNARLSFSDWTGKRAEYGLAQNFTVPYGANEEEYGALVIDWTPSEAIYALTEGEADSVSELSEELRNDIIVMEISFTDGMRAEKAVSIELRDDGRFAAAFSDYTVTDADDFVYRSDAQPIGTLQGGEENAEVSGSDGAEETLSAAREAALAYYAETVLVVEKMTLLEEAEGEAVFSVLVRKGGVLQEPERTVTLKEENGAWAVVNEGY